MDERKKDQIEDLSQDLGGATLEALLSLVPGVGPFLAVFANRTMGSSFERRTKRIISEIRDDLIRLEQSGQAEFSEQLADSDEFQAAMHRTIRRLLESGSDEKRKLLRNAMLNRAIGFKDADRFERALDACDADDVLVLVAIEEETRHEYGAHRYWITARYNIPRAFERWGAKTPDLLWTRVALLASLGLLDEDEKSEVKEHPKIGGRRSPGGDRLVERTVETKIQVKISEFGEHFLEYLADPLESDPATSDAPTD